MARKILNLDAMATETTPAPQLNIDVNLFNLNYMMNYTDNTDPANPRQDHYSENVNLNLSNEAELDRLLKEKPYLALIVPILANRLINNYDASNEAAKALKGKIKEAVTPPVQ